MMWRCSWPAVAAVLLLSGCSYPERGRVPEEEEGGAASSVVTVEYLKSHYRGYPYTFTESYRIRGCVVSSDRSGNYYKTLAVLDGSGAIELKLDSERLFETYAMGCLVDVSCNGLTLGAYGGCLQLGTAPSQGYETGYVDEADIPAVVRIVGMAEEAVEPQAREIAALRPEDVGRFVSFDGVQFVAGAVRRGATGMRTMRRGLPIPTGMWWTGRGICSLSVHRACRFRFVAASGRKRQDRGDALCL